MMNQAQAISLRNTLLMLNRTIRRLEDTLDTAEVVEPVFFWKNPLSDEKKGQIKKCTAELRGRIREIARAHGIQPEAEDLLKESWSRLSTHWVSIEDTKSKALARYGAVSPEDAAVLDPAMADLAALVHHLIAVVGSR
jgi:hypothetical protein